MPSNRLAQEKSPYLLQHAHNPVDWLPWGDEAFAKARAENKPIFLSVGYATCHWCHVMERESFESDSVADILNNHFVSIKVDREERPDVDRIYMAFVQATTGSGGWPMSVWMTPELKPFFGGTYFPPDNRYGRPGFASVLQQIAIAWRTQRQQLEDSAAELTRAIAEEARAEAGALVLDPKALDSAFFTFRRIYDSRYGGFGNAPKFPRPSVYNFLFRYWSRTGIEEARDMTLHTLREMAKGGMNDQLGGGFHRYSVDARWFVPHFEKMLYDQAQLASSYLDAFQVTRDPHYAAVATGIFRYVWRDMTHPEGGFFSAEDADSAEPGGDAGHKREGAFYVWQASEIDSLLGAAAADCRQRFGVRGEGNVSPADDPHEEFTARNILFQDRAPADPEQLAHSIRTLFAARAARPRPLLDDKILTSWNGLMISALARGAQALSESDPETAARCLESAQRAARFVMEKMYDASRGVLFRRWRDGEPAIDGFLDDYAFFVQALLDLYEADFDAAHLELALRLAHRLRELFEDSEHGGFFSTAPGKDDLILRLKEDYDGAEPSGNSVAVLALLRLATLTGDEALRESALRTLRAFASRIDGQGAAVPQMLAAWIYELSPKTQVILAGDVTSGIGLAMLHRLRAAFHPHTAVLALNTPENIGRLAQWQPSVQSMSPVGGKVAAYVCENFTCQPPVTNVEDLSKLLH